MALIARFERAEEPKAAESANVPEQKAREVDVEDGPEETQSCTICTDMATSAQTAMRKAAEVLATLTFIGMLVAIPLYSYDLAKHGTRSHLIAWFSAGAFTLLTFPISMHGIVSHLTHWYLPSVQKYVVRILWMVPIYSVESWLSLRFHKLNLYFETMRDMYEAYVIYSFLYYLIELLGGEKELYRILLGKAPHHTEHAWPLNLICGSRSQRKMAESPRESNGEGDQSREGLLPSKLRESSWARYRRNRDFLSTCKFGCLQYVIIKVLFALMTCILGGLKSNFRLSNVYLYMTVVSNFSQTWALYCMVLFYHCFKDELAKWRPIGKFLCVKAVVFFTWWQALCIEILRANDLIKTTDSASDWTSEDIASGLQDWLICIEMLGAALAHRYSFTYLDYKPESVDFSKDTSFIHAFLDSSVPRDVFLDIQRAAQVRLRLNSAFSFYDDDLDIEEHEDVRDSPRQQGLEMEAVLEPSDEPETT